MTSIQFTAAIALTGAIVVASPGAAHDRPSKAWVYSDENSHYLDMKTDISEAKRELRNDLRGADDAADRQVAWAEYRAEIADARADFAKEMAEQGITVRQPRVIVEE